MLDGQLVGKEIVICSSSVLSDNMFCGVFYFPPGVYVGTLKLHRFMVPLFLLFIRLLCYYVIIVSFQYRAVLKLKISESSTAQADSRPDTLLMLQMMSNCPVSSIILDIYFPLTSKKSSKLVSWSSS